MMAASGPTDVVGSPISIGSRAAQVLGLGAHLPIGHRSPGVRRDDAFESGQMM
jgi:hypothetical protein